MKKMQNKMVFIVCVLHGASTVYTVQGRYVLFLRKYVSWDRTLFIVYLVLFIYATTV